MNLSGALQTLAPGLVARYWAKRSAAEFQRRNYEAAIASHRYIAPTGGRSSGDAVLQRGAAKLRDWVRYLDENHDLVTGLLDSLVARVAGVGCEPLLHRLGSDELHEEANTAIRLRWEAWTRRPEVTRELHWRQVQALAARTWLRDGELFCRHVIGGGLDHRSEARYSIQCLEPDFVPFEQFDAATGIVQGIELSEWGRPQRYHVLEDHPGALSMPRRGFLNYETVPIAAEDMTHLKHVRRLHQRRGVTVLHSVITRLADIKDYEESERIAARVAASFTAVVKRNQGFGSVVTNDNNDSAFETQAGLVFDRLKPGEDVEVIDSKRPNTGLGEFRASQLRAVAAGTMMGYSTLAKDYNGTYSSQRQELVESWLLYSALRDAFVEGFVRPIRERWLALDILSGGVPAELVADVEPSSLFSALYYGAQIPWIDPKDETEADRAAVDAGFKSTSQVIRERGGTPRAVQQERQREGLPKFGAAKPTPTEGTPDAGKFLSAA